MSRLYLKENDRVFTTGAFLQWNGEQFIFDGLEDDTFFDGKFVNFDENGQPYTGENEDEK